MNVAGSLGAFSAAAGSQLPNLPYAFASGLGSRQPNFGFENSEGGDSASHSINLAVPSVFQQSVSVGTRRDARLLPLNISCSSWMA